MSKHLTFTWLVLLVLLSVSYQLAAPRGSGAVSAAPLPEPDAGQGVSTPGKWLHIIKSPDPVYVQRGGQAQFTIVVLNTSDNMGLRDVVVTDPAASKCARTVGDLEPRSEYSYQCTQEDVQASYTNLAQVTGTAVPSGQKDTATDTAVVELAELTLTLTSDVASLPEPGGSVRFDLSIRNTGSVAAKLNGLTSDQFGDLTSADNPLLTDNTCADLTPLPELAPGQRPLTCSFTAEVKAPPGLYEAIVTADALAGTGFVFKSMGEAQLLITDSASELLATLSAATDEAPLGSILQFAVTLTNASLADVITIVNMSDSELGDVIGSGTCTVPLELAPGEQYECAYQQVVSGTADETITYAFTASGINDDFPPQSVSAQATRDIRVYQPLAFLPVMSLPLNETCETSKRVTIGQSYQFAPSIQDAWYYFDLETTSTVRVEITNYVPEDGQMVIYSEVGPRCGKLTIEGNDGGFTNTKLVRLVAALPNRYFIRVFTVGPLNSDDVYTLRITRE